MSGDPVAAADSPEGRELSRRSGDSWFAVVQASGTATHDEIETATQMALAQFSPDSVGAEDRAGD